MTRLRKILYAAAFALAGAASLIGTQSSGQEIGQGMVRSGLVGIENETEGSLFWSLICTCGCPRETLGTCTCPLAHERRAELRQMLKDGSTIEQAQQEYVRRFGPQALAVPPSSGSNRLLYIVPLVAIALGAGLLVTVLRRWSGKRTPAQGALPVPGAPAAPGSAPVSSAPDTKQSRDDYDDKLDDELRRLDE